MYRFSPDFDVSFCIGHSLNQIAIGKYDVQFNFDSGVTIALQSHAEVLGQDKLIASWSAPSGWSSLTFCELLNRTVTHAHVLTERIIEIQFSDDFVLRLHDNSDQFESIQIFGKDQDLIVI
jgi:hypothetical protein